jgi:hypothetical protein
MLLGKTTSAPLTWPPAPESEGAKDLFHLALGWLKADKVVRKEREQVTGRIRGPKPEVCRVLLSLIMSRRKRADGFRRRTQRPFLRNMIISDDDRLGSIGIEDSGTGSATKTNNCMALNCIISL